MVLADRGVICIDEFDKRLGSYQSPELQTHTSGILAACVCSDFARIVLGWRNFDSSV